MVLRELLFVFCGAFVAGFAPTPSDDLGGRSGVQPGKEPQMCKRQKCTLAGDNPNKAKGKCVGVGYTGPGADGDIDLSGIDEDFCYEQEGGPQTCEYWRSGCDADPTASFCSQYTKAVNPDRHPLKVQTCPSRAEPAVDTFCGFELPELNKLPMGEWCGSIEDEDDCVDSVYQGDGKGSTTLYGRCVWEKGKCKKTRRPGYDEVYFCEETCKDIAGRTVLGTDIQCGRGGPEGFREPEDRLFSSEVCESYVSETVVPGEPSIRMPCVAQQPGGRGDVEQVCFQDCNDNDPTQPCTEACNCVEPIRVGKPGCAPTEKQCCKQTASGYTCVDCASLR